MPHPSNRLYTLYATDHPSTGPWAALPSQKDIPGTGGVTSLIDDAPAGTQRFYRIGVRVP